MKKKTKLILNATLDKAISPPKKRDLSKLDSLLEEYHEPAKTIVIKPTAEISVKEVVSSPKVKTEDNRTPSLETGLTGRTALTELTELTEPTELYRRVKDQPVSPIRDYTKTPNSIARVVMAKGLFKGKSKQIYDYLWTSSRGSINPSRKIRKTHGEIQSGTGIGSLNTVK